jgi:hypothetical protein
MLVKVKGVKELCLSTRHHNEWLPDTTKNFSQYNQYTREFKTRFLIKSWFRNKFITFHVKLRFMSHNEI